MVLDNRILNYQSVICSIIFIRMSLFKAASIIFGTNRYWFLIRQVCNSSFVNFNKNLPLRELLTILLVANLTNTRVFASCILFAFMDTSY